MIFLYAFELLAQLFLVNFTSLSDSVLVFVGVAVLIFAMEMFLMSIPAAFFTMALTGMSLKLLEGEKIRLHDIFPSFKVVANFYLSSILLSLIIILGVVLLIIPAFVFMIKYMFCGYLVLDRGAGPIQALKISGELTRGIKWRLFGFLLSLFGLSLGINLIGLLVLGVGLFVSIPISVVLSYTASAYVFRKLLEHMGGESPFLSSPRLSS